MSDDTPHDASLAETRAALLTAAIENVAFDGFVPRAIDDAAAKLKIAPEMARLAFPGGPRDLLRAWSHQLDDTVKAKLEAEDWSGLKIREKVTRALRARIEAMAAHRIAARRAAAYLAIPSNAALGAELSFRTADMIWRLAGDTATDFNFYSKRVLLQGVMTATLLFWFSDESEDDAETWAFLDRRIENVLRLEKAKAGLQDFAAKLPDPFKILGSLRYPSRGP